MRTTDPHFAHKTLNERYGLVSSTILYLRTEREVLEAGMFSDSSALEKCVQRLERENLRLKRGGIVLVVAVSASLLMGQSRSPRTVEAETIVLKGSDGSVRAKLDTKDESTEFLLYNRGGQPRVVIKSDAEGEGIEMRDDAGELLATVSVALRKSTKASPATSTIAVLGGPSGPGAVLQANGDGAIVRLDDKGGHRVWGAASNP